MSRVRIEQAKGVLAERTGASIDGSFDTLRRYARRHRLGITAVADGIVRGTLDIQT